MTLQPGDVGLSHDPGFVCGVIRWAEGRKYHTSPDALGSPAYWNHAWLVTSVDGDIVEAQSHGTVRATISEYAQTEHVVFRPPYAPEGGAHAAAAIVSMLGDKYGNLTIASEALILLTGTKLRFGISNHLICSGLVAHALELAGIDMGAQAEWSSPADVCSIALKQRWAIVENVSPWKP